MICSMSFSQFCNFLQHYIDMFNDEEAFLEVLFAEMINLIKNEDFDQKMTDKILEMQSDDSPKPVIQEQQEASEPIDADKEEEIGFEESPKDLEIKTTENK